MRHSAIRLEHAGGGSGHVQAFAPGRANLIGEHTDYNEGLCLPFAIERGVTVTAKPLGDRRIEAFAQDLAQSDAFALDGEIERPQPSSWRLFVRGAVAELRREGIEPRPCRLEIAGEVPRGAGLSSSAALSVSLCLALCGVAGAEPPPALALARLCSRIENDWCGAQTGLLDQLAVLCGEDGHALRIDFRTLELEQVPFDLGDWRLVTLDSGAEHEHAGGGYNERRAECEQAREQLGLDSLRDAPPDPDLPDPLNRRVRHVVSENARVDAMIDALAAGDLPAAAELLDASHASLRDDYEASVPAVEAAVTALKDAGAAGARMVGGGFGGSVLALLPPGAALLPGAFGVAPGPAARRLV